MLEVCLYITWPIKASLRLLIDLESACAGRSDQPIQMPGLLDTKGYDFYTCALIASYPLRLLVRTEFRWHRRSRSQTVECCSIPFLVIPCRLKFAIAVTAEMLGVLIFAFYSSSAPAEYAAWANGLSLAVVGETNQFLHISSSKALQFSSRIHSACGLLTNCVSRCLASAQLHHSGVQANTSE